ncbi:MAG: hypothetical protein ABIK28_08115, partial [Planctomycetota bacterium]
MEASAAALTRRWRVHAVAAGLLFLAYLPALREIYFLWDGWAWRLDALYWMKDPATLLTLDPSYSFRPLCRFLYLCLFIAFGNAAPAYLAFFLLLHFLTALLAGKLIHRLTGSLAAGTWTVMLFALSSAYTEVLQWIATFPHILICLEFMVIAWLMLPSCRSRSTRSAIGVLLVLLLATLTREPWLVFPALMLVVFLWAGGLDRLFSLRPIALVGFASLAAAVYLYYFRDILAGERVPGGLDVMAVDWDAVPRLLGSLSQLFLPRMFYGNALRNPFGG